MHAQIISLVKVLGLTHSSGISWEKCMIVPLLVPVMCNHHSDILQIGPPSTNVD